MSSVDQAIADIAAGKAVIVTDDADRENEGDLIFAAQHATPELVAFTVRHTSGFLCVALSGGTCKRLQLPPLYPENEDRFRTAYTVTVDALGVGTGISAADRAHTLRTLSDPAATAQHFTRPGHVVPLRARDGGVLTRAGHTEAALDLARLAGCQPAGALCEIVSAHDPTRMARGAELNEFGADHGLTVISIAELASWRQLRELPRRVTEARLPTPYGTFTAIGYTDPTGAEQLALAYGDVAAQKGTDVLVRLHSECLTGEALGSLRCDCGEQLSRSLAAISEAGCGVVVYLRGHEGRGIGLLDKLRAYQLQDAGADTVQANLDLGLPVDARDYGIGAGILAELGITSVRLLTNNDDKVTALAERGITVAQRVPMPATQHPENLRYLRAKEQLLGHQQLLGQAAR